MKAYKRLLAAVLILTMALALTACAGGKTESDPGPVRIATKPMTEQYILGEMLGLLIEQAGYKVEITKDGQVKVTFDAVGPVAFVTEK